MQKQLFLILFTAYFWVSCGGGDNYEQDHKEDLLDTKVTQPAKEEIDKLNLQARIGESNKANQFYVILNWNNKISKNLLLRRIDINEHKIVDRELTANLSEFNDYDVAPGKSYRYILINIDAKQQFVENEKVMTIPQDYVFSGDIVRLNKEQIFHFNRIFVKAHIKTGGNNITLKANQIIFSHPKGNVIDTLPTEAVAKNYQNGKHGGLLKIETVHVAGQLKVISRGAQGAQGKTGAKGKTGARGKQGESFQAHLFNRTRCGRDPTNGARGVTGTQGNRGLQGYKGGDSAQIFINVAEESPHFKYEIVSVGGHGGIGGNGGLGGNGGPGGAAGQWRWPCKKASIGPIGHKGKVGPKGPVGLVGTVKGHCVKIKNIKNGNLCK